MCLDDYTDHSVLHHTDLGHDLHDVLGRAVGLGQLVELPLQLIDLGRQRGRVRLLLLEENVKTTDGRLVALLVGVRESRRVLQPDGRPVDEDLARLLDPGDSSRLDEEIEDVGGAAVGDLEDRLQQTVGAPVDGGHGADAVVTHGLDQDVEGLLGLLEGDPLGALAGLAGGVGHGFLSKRPSCGVLHLHIFVSLDTIIANLQCFVNSRVRF